MTCFVRDKMNTSQIAMAEKLGLGIKKYRDIEKEKIYPDAETLVSLYNMSACGVYFRLKTNVRC